jgi:pimeloyl-ACP methyl ester carboxylesterase
MPSFMSDDVKIAYEVHGDGEPILLIHGFASNIRVNWRSTGWIDLLEKVGRQVIAIENRGHGRSQKLYEPGLYTSETMALDASRLISHLGHEQVDIMGYSMGARITAMMGFLHADQCRSLVIAGLAGNMITGVEGGEEIIAALQAPSAAKAKGEQGKAFRAFAEQTGSDLQALAACMAAHRRKVSVEELGQIDAPTLIVVGEKDEVAGKAGPLAEAIPGAESVVLERRDHMTAVGDKTFKLSVLDFLDRRL